MSNPCDAAYLGLLEDVLNNGDRRGDRTGTGTYSVFGRQLRFENVDKQFPLITTKRVFWHGVVEELMWFLKGSTNIKPLVDVGVNIWNDWPLKHYNSRHPDKLSMEEFTTAIKTNAEFAALWGELGPVYGKQWRAWADYSFYHHKKGELDPLTLMKEENIGPYDVVPRRIDQIAEAVKQLKITPESRRIIVNAWNPADTEEMAVSGLPPCHCFFQFYTRLLSHEERLAWAYDDAKSKGVFGRFEYPKTEAELDAYEGRGAPRRALDLQIYIRSNDLLLGAPFNIASYALLMMLVGKTVNMVAGTLVYTIGDAHIYANHWDAVMEQLKREPVKELPRVIISGVYDDPADYRRQDIGLNGYMAHGKLTAAAPIAV